MIRILDSKIGPLFVLGALASNPVCAQVLATNDSDVRSYGPESDGPSGDHHVLVLPDDTPSTAKAIDLSKPISSLSQAVQAAYWSNPTILAERARKRSSEYLLTRAYAQYGLSLNYEITHAYRNDRVDLPTNEVQVTSGWSSSASLILNQPLATSGRFRANERQAAATVKFQKHTLEKAEQDLLFAVVSAYALVIRDRNNLLIASENLELLTREYLDTERRYQARETTIADLQQVETRVRLAEAQKLIAKGTLTETEATFRSIVGANPGQLASLRPLALPVQSLDTSLEHALSNNPVILAANARERVSRALASGASAERLPRLDFRGRLGYLPVSPYSNELRSRGIVGEFVVSGPLFSSGALAARESEARVLNDADWRLVDAARRDLSAEVISAWDNFYAQTEAVESLNSAVEAAEAAYAGALIQQRAGTRTTLDVLILARELLTARTSLNNAIADAYLARARILLALGDLDAVDLFSVSPREQEDDSAATFAVSPLTAVVLGPVLRAINMIGQPEVSDRSTRDLLILPEERDSFSATQDAE